jgi:hypothetical protein
MTDPGGSEAVVTKWSRRVPQRHGDHQALLGRCSSGAVSMNGSALVLMAALPCRHRASSSGRRSWTATTARCPEDAVQVLAGYPWPGAARPDGRGLARPAAARSVALTELGPHCRTAGLMPTAARRRQGMAFTVQQEFDLADGTKLTVTFEAARPAKESELVLLAR